MTLPLGTVCKHGSLKPSCYVCDVEAERDQLKATIARLDKAGDELNAVFLKVAAERDHLQSQLSVAHKHIQDMQVTNSDLTAKVDALKADNARLRRIEEAARDFIYCRVGNRDEKKWARLDNALRAEEGKI